MGFQPNAVYVIQNQNSKLQLAISHGSTSDGIAGGPASTRSPFGKTWITNWHMELTRRP